MSAPWPKWYRPKRRIFVSQLVREAAAHLNVTPEELTGPGRARELVRARAAISRVARDQGYSYPQIGRLLGGRDHTTIMHLIKEYPYSCSEITKYQAMVLRLQAMTT